MTAPLEPKPSYIDFASPIAVAIAARVIRAAAADPLGARPLIFAEMLPAPDHAWLPDATDDRYLCELRIVADDQAPIAAVS